jgi:cysteine-rich PDZ-binding protein
VKHHDAESFSFLGESKLQRVICPDVWKDGASNTLESGGRQLNENKLLSNRARPRGPASGAATAGSAPRFNPYVRKCKICKGNISQQGAYYCQTCAYQKGEDLLEFFSFVLQTVINLSLQHRNMLNVWEKSFGHIHVQTKHRVRYNKILKLRPCV